MGTIIIGGGIIGTSIAYSLSKVSDDIQSIHIVEASPRLFASASGYAGGFLAKDWFSPAAAELALSLAMEEGVGVGVGAGEWGEDWLLNGTSRAEVSAGSGLVSEDGTPAWLTQQKGGSLDVISREDDCAQVDPLRLCEFMMKECKARGVQVHYPAQLVSLRTDKEGILVGGFLVSYGGNAPVEIACKNIIIASGAWTPAVFKKLFDQSNISIPISPLAGYSLLCRSPRHSLLDEEKYGRSHAIFSAPTSSYTWAPEIFSRKGGEIYLAGLNDPSLPLPEYATGAIIKDELMAEIKKAAVRMMGRATSEGNQVIENDLAVSREAICFRPVTDRGTPIITRVSDSSLGSGTRFPHGGGLFIAAGHGPWGISLSLGTGKVVAEMIRGENTSANISQLGF